MVDTNSIDTPTIITQHLDELIELCHQFGVKRLYAFGSVLTNRFNPEKSDLDFVRNYRLF
jgi:predicted nucleotidyltransferase